VKATERRLTAHDGWSLGLTDVEPAGAPLGIAITGHAMMVDRRTIYRGGVPTLGRTLVEHGLRVLVPDLRGRGVSGPTPREGGDWSYADLIADTGALVRLAGELAPDLPIFLVGHSLFSHAALAWLGENPRAPVRAVAALALNIWGPAWTPSLSRWLKKRATIAGTQLVAAAFGYMPSGRFGFGSCDEAKGYWRDLSSWVTRGRWGDARTDYHANLAGIRCPVLHVVSDGDVSFAVADEALRFSAILGERRSVLRVGPACTDDRLRALAPDHMPMVTSRTSEPIWRAVAEWLVARATTRG
jgi:predicted alpha/beta hydrolase